MCATLFLLLAIIGLAFDFGRVYVVRNEAQIFTDAAALTAASKLSSGADAARAAVEQLPGRWNFGTQPITGVKVEFSDDREHWSAEAANPQYVRVIAPANDVAITFLRALGTPSNMRVAAASVAAVTPVRLVE